MRNLIPLVERNRLKILHIFPMIRASDHPMLRRSTNWKGKLSTQTAINSKII